MGDNIAFSDLSLVDYEVLKRFRIVLYNLLKENMLKTTDDLDTASYRLLNILKQERQCKLST